MRHKLYVREIIILLFFSLFDHILLLYNHIFPVHGQVKILDDIIGVNGVTDNDSRALSELTSGFKI